MSAGRGEDSIAAGGLARHAPVLLAEALQALNVREGGVYIDGTFGAGGYTRGLLERGARVIAVDRDPFALADGQALAADFAGRLNLTEGRFADLDAIARRTGFDHVDGVALDLGVSSMQLDEAARGFSLRRDAPLDMRMEAKGPSAADILREADEATIADILFYFGEERASRRIARAIVADRESAPYVSTRQLAEMIARVAPARPGEATHPATRAFQALRIAVNDELGQLLGGLMAAERALKPGGRLAVVSFHSLEDRIVKLFLARRSGRGRAPSRLLPGEPAPLAPSFGVAAGQPILPGPAEIAANPRARSAKLRFAERRDGAGAGSRRRPRSFDQTAGGAGGEGLMWRLLHVIAIAALLASAAYVYSVKYQTIYSAEQIVKTRHQIAKEHDAINLLRAEYAHLTRPDRLQALADKQLDMQPLALTQIVKADDLPDAAPKVDSIGRKLESLGLLGDSATPSAGVSGATPSVR